MIPSADGDSGIDPDIVRQLHEMAAQLKINEDTIATLVRQQAQEEKDDVTADYF